MGFHLTLRITTWHLFNLSALEKAGIFLQEYSVSHCCRRWLQTDRVWTPVLASYPLLDFWQEVPHTSVSGICPASRSSSPAHVGPCVHSGPCWWVHSCLSPLAQGLCLAVTVHPPHPELWTWRNRNLRVFIRRTFMKDKTYFKTFFLSSRTFFPPHNLSTPTAVFQIMLSGGS